MSPCVGQRETSFVIFSELRIDLDLNSCLISLSSIVSVNFVSTLKQALFAHRTQGIQNRLRFAYPEATALQYLVEKTSLDGSMVFLDDAGTKGEVTVPI